MGSADLTSDRDHKEVRGLLPWYVTGRLDTSERLRVAEHLTGCAACRDDLASERALGAVVASSPFEVDAGWERLQRQISRPRSKRQALPRRVVPLHIGARWRGGVAVAIAAQLVLLVAAALVLTPRHDRSPAYHVLGTPRPAAAGNVILMMAPGASTATMSGLVVASGGRVVDGPTAAGAFVLAVPAAQRPQALMELKASRDVILAEPIDP